MCSKVFSGVHPDIIEAYSVLNGVELDRALVERLSNIGGRDVLDLVSLAHKVCTAFQPEMHTCTIMNAKSGQCSENCKFCAQSAHHTAEVDVYELESVAVVVDRAKAAYENGVRRFGIVTSGLGFLEINESFKQILEAIDTVYEKFPDMSICASLGLLSEATACELAKRNIAHYNINIQTNPAKYKELVSSTHDIQDRVKTIKLLKHHGIKVCCGGILGLGESMSDRVEMAYALKDLDVDVIPLNVLIPIKGTPLEGTAPVVLSEIVKTFALFRLIHPEKVIKFAAGRETKMKDFQGLIMLAGANGLLTGGYLTTRGRNVEEDESFIEDLQSFE